LSGLELRHCFAYLDALDLRADDGSLRDEFPELPGTRFQAIVAAYVAERHASAGGSRATVDPGQ